MQRSAPISHVDELKRLRDENGLKDAEIARLKLRQAAIEAEMENMKLTLAVLKYLLYLLYGYKGHVYGYKSTYTDAKRRCVARQLIEAECTQAMLNL